jgi:hypothetical protein
MRCPDIERHAFATGANFAGSVPGLLAITPSQDNAGPAADVQPPRQTKPYIAVTTQQANRLMVHVAFSL